MSCKASKENENESNDSKDNSSDEYYQKTKEFKFASNNLTLK